MSHWRYAVAIQNLGNWCINYLVPRNWRNVKTHNLISGMKSEDTYGYVPDYTKPLTSIGCHIGFIFIRSYHVWMNTLLDNKNPRYRHRSRLPVSRFQDYWIPYILAIMLIHSNQGNYEKCSIVIIRHPAIFSNWGTIQLICVIKARGICPFRFHFGLY